MRVAVHTELLHELAVPHTVFHHSLVTHDGFFHSEYFTCLLTVKIAWGQGTGVEYFESCIFLP